MHRGKHVATRGFGKLSLIIALMMVFALMAIAPLAVAAPAEKIDICHYDADTDLFKLINISGNAFDRHMAHGDGEPESWVEDGGYGFTEDCWRWDISSDLLGAMSAERVWANGGAYENPYVQNAIDQGYVGLVNFDRYLNPSQVVFFFTFENLAASTPYTIYLDNNGGTPGPFALLGTFTTNASGEGTFGPYAPALAAGSYNWAFWVNEPSGSVLQTEIDQNFEVLP